MDENEKRERELQRIPAVAVNHSEWPKHVRRVGMNETGALGIDAKGALYWHGKPIQIREHKLQRLERFLVFVVALSAMIGVSLQVWEWGCRLNWLPLCPVI
jgi:hypothetical protein